MKKILLTLIVALAALAAHAQKQLYIPNEWKGTNLYRESDPNNQYTWSKSRSKESENFIVYWDKDYGKKAPNELSSNDFYYVDIDDLLQKAEWFYELNVTKLGFGGEGSKLAKYKSMILINHTTEWMAYGSGYDFNCPALWINPATCKPVGHTIAHEIGHSFQYMGYSDLGGHAGFHDAIGKGSGWWEQTAQWQAAQAYPDLKWGESWTVYGAPYFPRYANYAMTHEWMRYQSYWWHYYLVEKFNDRSFIGKLWRHQMSKASDPNEVLMDMQGLSVEELYKLYFEYAMKMATVDIDVDGCREEGVKQINSVPYRYACIALGDSKYQVAYSSCPQSTGFNIIPLIVPEPGTVVSIDFTSLKQRAKLADGDPAEYYNGDNQLVKLPSTKAYYNINSKYGSQRGFRLGYVALLKDGSRKYLYEDELYCANSGTNEQNATVSCTVPEGTQKLFFVVSPAPKQYIQHQWDDDISNDDQWPYTIQLSGTDLIDAPEPYVAPVISEELGLTDATITYNVELPRHTTDYSYVAVTVAGNALSVLGTAFQMKDAASGVSSSLVEWSSTEPANGQMKFYATSPSGEIVNKQSSANGYGHWFNASGAYTTWGSDCYVYSEFQPASLTFNVGQKPSTLTVGKTYTISQALKYKQGGKTATVRFIFNVKCVAASASSRFSLAKVEQDPKVAEYTSAIAAPAVPSAASLQDASYYTLSGTRLSGRPTTKGIYLHKGKKLLIR